MSVIERCNHLKAFAAPTSLSVSRKRGVFRAPSVRRLTGTPRRDRKSVSLSVLTRVAPELEEIEVEKMDDRIPVTVITGFLGSGKTTLLNNILTKDHGKRIAVIENEFGEIDIDGDLVSQKYNLEGTGDMVMMLNNGCLCCTVRDDLVKSLNALYDKRDQFDHIVIETTGMANVSPIISTFYLTEQLPERVRLDGVVTVVDAKHVVRHLDRSAESAEGNEVLDQIAYADRIVLNKTDLIEESAVKELESRIKNINSMASLSKTTYANVSVDYVLGIGGFDVNRVDEQLMEPDHKEEHDHDHHHDHHDHDHGHGHKHHDHDDSIRSVNITIDGDVDLEKMNNVLGALVDMRGEDIYRMKGIISIKGWEERFVFQGVHMLFEGLPDRPWRPDEKRVSKMVFIGKDLDQEDFEKALNTCRA